MKTVGINSIPENFVFIVDGHRYDCPTIFADFFSPNICLQHSVDPSITEFIVETKDMHANFELFKSLLEGATIRVTEANRTLLL
jgi:hypothetical protein